MPEHRLAVVTGGSRGIGRAVAVKLAGDGFDVAFCYRSGEEHATETERMLHRLGRRVYRAACDVTDAAAAKAFVAAAEAELGPAAVLVNSAGIVRDNPLVLMPPADWHSVIDTNLNGAHNFCRAVVFGFMKRRSGVIVNVSSVVGVRGNAGQSNYAASKAGVHGMTMSLAKELAGHGVRVNAVAPGLIDTGMTDRLSGRVLEKALSRVPMRRLGEAADVAELVGFLTSERAAYITGQVIQVDGGIAL